MGRVFQKNIIQINSRESINGTDEYFKDGRFYLRIGGFNRTLSLFEKFGENVRRIEIDYDHHLVGNDRRQINEEIIKKHAKNLTELRITTYDDRGLWEAYASENGEVPFPNVKKFYYFGSIKRSPFDLKTIFPALESCEFLGVFADTNLLANFTRLKELSLGYSRAIKPWQKSISEQQLEHIFAKNNQLSTLRLARPTKQILRLIKRYLNHLETFKAPSLNRDFLIKGSDPVYELTSVKSFEVTFDEPRDLMEELSFAMPNLKKLKMSIISFNVLIVNFINRFKELETVHITQYYSFNIEEAIEKLNHVKEVIIKNFENTRLEYVKKLFERFDETKPLHTLKLVLFKETDYPIFEEKMIEINGHLETLNKPKWKLSRGKLEDSAEKYLMFTRESRQI